MASYAENVSIWWRHHAETIQFSWIFDHQTFHKVVLWKVQTLLETTYQSSDIGIEIFTSVFHKYTTLRFKIYYYPNSHINHYYRPHSYAYKANDIKLSLDKTIYVEINGPI